METLRINAGEAYWAQRSTIEHDAPRLRQLVETVGRPSDLWPYQWAQLMSFALEMRPDLILELGRGYGNSTCAFTEVANMLGPGACRVVSICYSGYWHRRIRRRLESRVPADWFEPLKILRRNILTWDCEAELRGAHRVLVFWDAHGFEVAEWVLGRLAPLLADREHAILMHDMSDTRYQDMARRDYDGRGLWKGQDDARRLRIGMIDSTVEQSVSILDFTSRNGIDLRSAEDEIRTYFADRPDSVAAMRSSLGELFSLGAGWFWFQLHGSNGRVISYPHFDPKTASRPLRERALLAVKILIRG